MLEKNQSKTVAVAMSGGVDSSVTAALLNEAGYDVIGVTLKLWMGGKKGSTAVSDAKAITEQLGIPHHVLDYQDGFNQKVIDYFTSAYVRGITPNPCPVCNDTIKFGDLLSETERLGADFLATGHYARIEKRAERFIIRKGVDPVKDQSYFLYRLNQKRLGRLLFPLGTFLKKDIRAMAARFDLHVKDKPESQDICFIENDNYRAFLTDQLKTKFETGPIIDQNGHTVGEHKGLPFYTIGQRKGLGVALGKPVYVTCIDVANNSLVVGENEQRRKTRVAVDEASFVSGVPPEGPVGITVKIRSTAKEARATLTALSKNRVEIRSEEPLLDVAPGQSAVFYQGDVLLGGGVIQRDDEQAV